MIASAFRRSAVLAFGIVPFVSACSLVYSTDDARRAGPTSPAIHVEPASPGTLDDLKVVLDEPSSDRFGSDVTYEYAWTKQGTTDLVGTTDTIAASMTTRGDVFTVRVTPIAADGRRGVPAEVTVTVANSAPRLSYAGLSRYDVFRDDALSVFVGPETDADGDPVTRRIEWRIDGTAIGITSSQLSLGNLSLSAGSRIEVVVTPNDGRDDGVPVIVGPARVRGPGTQWRPLVPDHGPHGTMGDMLGWHAVFDEEQRRLLFFPAVTVPPASAPTARFEPWEYAIDQRRWARLVPADASGGDFGTYARPVVDAAHRRVIFYGELDQDPAATTPMFAKTIRIFHLDRRGAEAWETITVPAGSSVPHWRFGESAVLDAVRGRILLYGGLDYNGPFDDLWALRLDDGNVRWEQLAASTTFGPIVGGTWLVDAPGGAAYLAGGTFAESGSFPPTAPRVDVYRLDLATNTFGGGPVAQLPSSVSMASAIPLPDGSGALLIGGMGDFSTQPRNDTVWRFDFGARTFTDVSPPPGVLVGHYGVWPSLGIDRATGRVLVATTGGNTDRGVSFYSLAAEGQDLAAIDVYGVTTPPALSQLGAVHDSQTLTVFFGLREPLSFGTDLVEGHAWSFRASGRFEPADTVGQPSGRYGFGVARDPSVSGRFLVVGGRDLVGGTPTPRLEAYSFSPTNAPGWTSSGSLAPAADYSRTAVAACSSSSFALFGGDSAGGGTVSTVSNVTCSGATCSVAASTGTLPTGTLVGAAFAYSQAGYGYLVGGEGPSSGVWSFMQNYVCWSAPQTATQLSVPAFPTMSGGAAYVLPYVIAAQTDDLLVVASWAVAGETTLRAGRIAVSRTDPTNATFDEPSPATSDRPIARSYFGSAQTETGNGVLVYGGEADSSATGRSGPLSDLWQLRYEAP